MDKAVVLGALEDLIGLLLADEAVLTGFGEVYGVVVEVHAHVLLQMSAALAHEPARAAAGAGTDGDGPCLLYDGRQLIVGGRSCVALNGAHNGHDAHEVHAAAEHGSEHADADAGILLEADTEVGILFALLTVREDALHDAGHPDGIVVAGLLAAVTDADNARVYELVALLLNKFGAFSALLCELLRRKLLLQTHAHHDGAHVVVNDGSKYSVLGILVGDARVGQALKADLRCQRKDVRSVGHSIFPL